MVNAQIVVRSDSTTRASPELFSDLKTNGNLRAEHNLNPPLILIVRMILQPSGALKSAVSN